MEEIQASLETYELQLAQVQQAIKADPTNEDLTQLVQDLQQVISLSIQSLIAEKKKQLLAQLPPSNDEGDNEEEVDSAAAAALESDLNRLVGMKVKAPHVSKGSGLSASHNAIVFQNESDSNTSFSDFTVRVVFSHPTSTDMVPCPFYLDGRCRFEDFECKYSHGEVVKLSELSTFEDPNYIDMGSGKAVLAKAPGEALWRHATVEAVEDCMAFLRFSHDHKELKKVKFEDLLPLSASKDVVDSDDDIKSCDFPPVDLLEKLSASSAALGQWEAHTTGVASKLMAKMGYVMGMGLGKNSDGRVDPVTAMIYPQGKSLDWCMDMRERVGGGDALSVEKTLIKQREREERRFQRQEERDQKGSVFDFINNRLGSGTSASPGRVTSSATSLSLSKEGESLNIQAFKLAEDVRKVEKDVVKLKASYERLKERDSKMAAGIKVKIDQKSDQLTMLRNKEQSVTRTKAQKDGNKKLTIF